MQAERYQMPDDNTTGLAGAETPSLSLEEAAAQRERAWLSARYREQQAQIQASAALRTEITQMLETDQPDLPAALAAAIRCIGLMTGDGVFARQCEAAITRHAAP